MPYQFGPFFPFRRDNRKPDGTWDAPDATGDNIRGTSVDPHKPPTWPRWKQMPPPHSEGEFVSHEPFFDIDEINQKAEFYPPGRPLVDTNVDDNPASRQRVGDMPGGNFFRRRLLIGSPEPESSINLAQDTGPQVRPAPVGAVPPRSEKARQLQLLYDRTRPNKDFPGWAVNWQFDRLPDSGFVMQKIQRHEETPTGEKINHQTFWEFWPVSKYARQTDLQRDLRVRHRITKPGEDAHTPDDTLGQDRRLGRPSRAGNRIVVHSEASLWVGERIPEAAKISPESSAKDLRIMTTDPGLVPDPALSIRRGYSQPLR